MNASASSIRASQFATLVATMGADGIKPVAVIAGDFNFGDGTPALSTCTLVEKLGRTCSRLAETLRQNRMGDEEAADAVVESFRFESSADRVLARYEGDEDLALFPAPEDLRARGINVDLLAVLLEAGAVSASGLDVMLLELSVADFNGALENVEEMLADGDIDPVERAMAMYE